MALSNDSVTVTPGTGATIATHLVSGKEYQVVMIAGADGQLEGSKPRYRLVCPSQAVGANKLYVDFFNAVGSGVIINVLSAFAYADLDTAVTGTVGVEIDLFRTNAVGTGGTAATYNGTVNTALTISSLDTNNPALSANITARMLPTAGATIHSWLAARWVFTEETNAGTALAGLIGAEFIRNEGSSVVLREGYGLLFKQGTVAGVGNISFEINFEII